VSERLGGPRQTNQRAELTAVLRAIQVAPLHQEVKIYTDSMYSINCVTNWSKNWQRRGWINAAGNPVENRDLVEAILDRMQERSKQGGKTSFQWVKGHSSDPGNIAADLLAVAGARKTLSI